MINLLDFVVNSLVSRDVVAQVGASGLERRAARRAVRDAGRLDGTQPLVLQVVVVGLVLVVQLELREIRYFRQVPAPFFAAKFPVYFLVMVSIAQAEKRLFSYTH